MFFKVPLGLSGMQLALEKGQTGVLILPGRLFEELFGPICLVEVVMMLRGGTIKPLKVVMNELNGLMAKIKGKS